MKTMRNAGWEWLMAQRWLLPVLIAVGFVLAFAIPEYNLFNKYIQLVMMYVGINIILTVSLNLVNGYMGEFSLAHAGFMAVGAYTAALLTQKVLPVAAYPGLFPLAVLAGGLMAALLGLIVAVPSFKVRGDYLAIITLAFLMIVKSVIENIDFIGGPRGIPGIKRLTTLPWVFSPVELLRTFIGAEHPTLITVHGLKRVAAFLANADPWSLALCIPLRCQPHISSFRPARSTLIRTIRSFRIASLATHSAIFLFSWPAD